MIMTRSHFLRVQIVSIVDRWGLQKVHGKGKSQAWMSKVFFEILALLCGLFEIQSYKTLPLSYRLRKFFSNVMFYVTVIIKKRCAKKN